MSDDNKWRYSRDSDMGRCTASNFDMSDPSNLIVPEEFKEEIRLRKEILELKRAINFARDEFQLPKKVINRFNEVYSK